MSGLQPDQNAATPQSSHAITCPWAGLAASRRPREFSRSLGRSAVGILVGLLRRTHAAFRSAAATALPRGRLSSDIPPRHAAAVLDGFSDMPIVLVPAGYRTSEVAVMELRVPRCLGVSDGRPGGLPGGQADWCPGTSPSVPASSPMVVGRSTASRHPPARVGASGGVLSGSPALTPRLIRPPSAL